MTQAPSTLQSIHTFSDTGTTPLQPCCTFSTPDTFLLHIFPRYRKSEDFQSSTFIFSIPVYNEEQNGTGSYQHAARADLCDGQAN